MCTRRSIPVSLNAGHALFFAGIKASQKTHSNRPSFSGPVNQPYYAIRAASPGLLAQLLVIPLFRDHHILTMVSSKNDCIKLLPPLSISETQVHQFLSGLEAVLEASETNGSGHWSMLFEILQKVGLQTLQKKRRLRNRAQNNGRFATEIP